MRFPYAAPSPSCCAYSLRLSDRRDTLLWDCTHGADTLVLETPFGQCATELFPAFCEALEAADLAADSFVQLRAGVWARYVSAGARARMNGGCPLHREACTYTVLACEINGNVCTVYAPAKTNMVQPSLDVPLQIHVEVSPEMRRNFPWSHPKFIGYFRIDLPRAGVPGDGTLSYTVGGIRVPITDGMLAQGAVYVRSDVPPTLVSTNPGLKLK